MVVKLERIDSIETGLTRSGRRVIEADIEFDDEEDIIEEFGAQKCVEALDETEVYKALGGWDNAKNFYAEEIQEEIEANKK